MSELLEGFLLVFNFQTLLVILLAALFGVFVGAVPGLSATMAVALLVPITFYMDATSAIAAIITTAAMAIFAGDIPGAYLNIPGTPASAAYVGDASKLGRQGRARECLGTNLICSVIGGLAGTIVLILVAPSLAEFALNFSSFEYFWLAVLGLSSAVFISQGSPVKGFLSLMVGLLLGTVGLDMVTGTPRFTFDIPDLMAGINFIPVMIGFFALNEVMKLYASKEVISTKGSSLSIPQQGTVFGAVPGHLKRYWRNAARGSTLGVLIGALPGAGADIAAWISYAISKKRSKTPELYGTGHMEGIVDASSANNAGICGAWVPALVFGIPGDSITAIVIGVLYMKGMNPGPTIFMDNSSMAYGLFIAFFVANLILIPVGYLAIHGAHIFAITPAKLLMPIILCFCIVGAFAINNTLTDVWIMLACGIAAYVLSTADFPTAPAILGLVLGNILETNFLTSILKANGDLMAFFQRPISASLGALVLLIVLYPLISKLWLKRRAASALQSAQGGH
ncbi:MULTISPECIES: tripartite tricarboxylate transporter permease [Pseudomonas]|uniref:Protein TctA n=1 Tax=Pseudomonas luteola TaxID=47886 RepID=A0A2X2DH70_PSELU|nr:MULTISPECIES: tripartite tricarboxylate transporter permease [Pseudomonas]MBF8642714.1 tripartite tricarboxylate transporter permease [Pseudomonas zeshuii]RRW44572.1 C4-dicarboxylate ABC transporter permease [Pseudomonas luteola]SHJ37397.1 TctA family transporter [Pseudomonas zeshuii]SPZ16826.1 protein TctA [Pseudomonas luteola]